MPTVSNLPQPAGAPGSATAPWVVVTLLILSAVVGGALCIGAAVLVWVRPGTMGPLTTALSMAAFLVGMAALVVSVVVAVRR